VRYLFRVDASQAIGSGHVMRCASLASALRARGAQTCFVSLELPAHLESLLQAQGHEVRRLPEAVRGDELADARATLDGETAVAACVVDHYHLGEAWESAVMTHAPVLALDDLGRPHVSRWLLDQNHYADPQARYETRCPAHVERLFGPTFALLRDEFAQARACARVRDGAVRHVLVFLGAMDAQNFTATALKAIDLGMTPSVQVTVIAGASHPDLPGLQAWCDRRGQAELHVQVRDMTPHLLAADLAIGAGGSSTWERCACGLPTVAISLADNQREVILEGARAGFLWGIDHVPSADELATVLRVLSCAPGLVQHLSRQSLQVTDANGADRVADLLMPETIQVRPGTYGDARMIYDWRTSPEVMGSSRSTGPFTFEDHCAWLERVLKDPQRLLLIGLREGREAGVVRFDIDRCRAEVSIFLAPGMMGNGLGRALLAASEARLRYEHPHVTHIDAWVNANNPRSFRLFQHLGYCHHISRLEKEFAQCEPT
jgi:UDP-2,4-diacetamido-2,4,6-trideoxy-beta-L-altropyranose hydrolase